MIDSEDVMEPLGVDPSTSSRIRPLSERGKELYAQNYDSYHDNVESSWKDIEEFTSTLDKLPKNKDTEDTLSRLYAAFCEKSETFINFLSSQRTAVSHQDLEGYLPVMNVRRMKIDSLFKSLRSCDRGDTETVRSSSCSSRSSRSRSSRLSMMRAKTEATKAEAAYALKEVEIRKQQAELQAKLDTLTVQKKVAAAEVELKVLEEESTGITNMSLRDLPIQPTAQRTASYVEDQSSIKEPSVNCSPLEPQNRQIAPCSTQSIPVQVNTQNSAISEVTQFMLRKDLLFSRLTTFDDRPESYCAWKYSFNAVIQEIKVQDSEQMDLLIKYLGTESKRHALSIRSSNLRDMSEGLKRLWKRLDERYGAAELVEASMKNRIASFPKLNNKDYAKLYELCDILSEMQFLKEEPKYQPLFAYLDSSVGIRPIVSKLPYFLQEKWTTRAFKYKSDHDVTFPPFQEFVNFIHEMSLIRNDPSFIYDNNNNQEKPKVIHKGHVTTKKTEIATNTSSLKPQNMHQHSDSKCIVHSDKDVKHITANCRVLKAKPLPERFKLLKQENLCFRCCASTKHQRKDCSEKIQCKICQSSNHVTVLHENDQTMKEDGGELQNTAITNAQPRANTKCTEICDGSNRGKSCAKILPVTLHHGTQSIDTYAMLDDQSNRTLAKRELFDQFDIKSPSVEFLLTSCSGEMTSYGRIAHNLVMESYDGSTRMTLPTVLECNNLPENYIEIPTPDVAKNYTHLNDIASKIMPLDKSRQILVLIGRDLLQAHHIIDQRICTNDPTLPFAQQTPFGWTIIGDVCLSGKHAPRYSNTYKTFISTTGRASILEPCPQVLQIKEHFLIDDLFERSKEDNKIGTSVDDRKFMDLMDREMHLGPENQWIAPLPFVTPRKKLPDNFNQALRRAKSLDLSLHRDEVKRDHFLTFMQKLLDKNHAELAPPLHDNQERWYLPLFGVYHPRKPNEIRGVFDSSAKEQGISLNDILLSGPDLTNSLLGVLLQFRKEMVAVVGDVQHMFHCFLVREDHRDYLRFLWHRDNDLQKELTQYRMRVHVFGNRPSPSIATYGLLKTAMLAEKHYGTDVKNFITNNFYVDDGLASCPSSEEAINLLRKTQEAMMKYGNLRLHKFASNDKFVMEAFKQEDLAPNMLDLDFDQSEQRSLGLVWNLALDVFVFRKTEDKPLTRRGVLSTVNSIYDPLGFLYPVIIQGKLILRKVVSETNDWDEPLSDELKSEWLSWKDSLSALEDIRIPRVIVPSLSKVLIKELIIFSDASEHAIAAVCYLKTTYADGNIQIGYVLGKAKVAPVTGHTIPRLELCAAVLATDIAQLASDHLNIKLDSVKYYTDSRVVLGYICNDKRRFFVYVSNRVARIRSLSTPEQWNYIASNLNPADHGTRCVKASELQNNPWLKGPAVKLVVTDVTDGKDFPLINPSEDNEVKISCMKTNIPETRKPSLGTERFQRFSTWKKLVEAIALLRRFLASRKNRNPEYVVTKDVESYKSAENFVLQCVQQESYAEEYALLLSSRSLPKGSNIISLDPFIGCDNLVHVGGRLRKSDFDSTCKNPILIPGNHHIAKLIVLQCHVLVAHQGRHYTEGKVRSCGYWITGSKRLVTSVIFQCFTCRKLRGHLECQKMSDLPADRIAYGQPPFSSVGVDMFGPWQIQARRTRGGVANSKRWAAMFSCMATRAVHIEVVEEMSSSSFINALRRFIAIRGPVHTIRSDRGTNFIGAADLLRVDTINVQNGPVKDFVQSNGIVWIFNPPHSSHMGGAWERMIGMTRRILDSMFLQNVPQRLTHEVLITFLAEASAIINSRPLIPVSTDPSAPFILTPSLLITQKSHSSPSLDFASQDCDPKDLLRSQWKRVQHLSNIFWKRWKSEYLPILQMRRKWNDTRQNIQDGDIVLLKDKSIPRNQWPIGLITKSFPSSDQLVRKVEVRVIRDGKPTTYTRPITDLVLLLDKSLDK